MTGPCSGAGVGVAKSGFAALQYIGPGAIGGALAGLAGWQGAAVGATIGALTFDLATFCPDGPPAMPTFSAGDIVALLAPVPTAARAAAALKFQDFLGNIFWPLLCDCSSGTSTLGAPSTYPSGAPQTTPSPQTSGVCLAVEYAAQPGPTPNTVSHWYQNGTVSNTDTLRPLPSSAYWWTLDAAAISNGATHYSMDITLQAKNAAGTNLSPALSGTIAVAAAPGGAAGPLALSGPIPAGAVTFHLEVESGNTAVTDKFNLSVKIYCSGAPGQVIQPCCPPDTATQALLDQLLAMVTLIQRQSAPFSYVYGDNHTGLTGDDEITVADLLGVSVDVTTLPSSYGTAAGTPVKLFDLGFVSLGTADGWIQSRRVDSDGALFLPPGAGVFTRVGWSLSPGVEVSIRELIREP